MVDKTKEDIDRERLADIKRRATFHDIGRDGLHTVEGLMPHYTPEGLSTIAEHGIEAIDKYPAFPKETARAGEPVKGGRK